jgi:hypothetical protein
MSSALSGAGSDAGVLVRAADGACYIDAGTEHIYFARQSDRTVNVLDLRIFITIQFVFFVVCLAGVVRISLRGLLPAWFIVVLIATAALAHPFMIWRSERWRRARFESAICAGYPRDMRERWRVVCVGELHNPVGAPDPIGHQFEPQVFKCTLGVRPDGVRGLFSIATIVAVGVLLGAIRCVMLDVSWYNQVHLPMSAGIVVGGFLACFLWPVYARVSPGRLEVLSWPLFLPRPHRREQYDLRRARVTVDFVQRAVSVSAGERRWVVQWSPVRGGARLAYYTLLAAVASQAAVELPEDALVG